ncbi:MULTISPECIES: tRNA pseudouridine(38-40) synthase TruA [unclassified Clostridioides]|uniref:tRNA pseudouridine(38-40) synthase TruA n=1 Tax=unclassified Clostridioides TaxID=2635829 RepID=UPI001D0C304E|nr:tRNA pseudouridine(38-40) synthase TruA [Clostridioides sp. ES-S-0001-02]MCC0639839.1 tRNA pseudouridine(38-40) synthase TruA [Clostridioides sp. ES-S-0049-03]MCC0653586.1 tRNA pseudouridine(38-40) synthase TruA [Clostridioides sp. ES-S-0001-03]MCC0655333.1 tRNA pseudouridine(38-40) synthase TruA [Clostridioides sp. ES-S-0123-01]MCC0671308.1 tRNA pseudouridine(38-40) synthase TruA [Clostridioides sp. ES-S-0145-01]MCC0674884.1 tRNA pseudouridine(38-40) synthase TruA [Clostridioides sp. ES-W-
MRNIKMIVAYDGSRYKGYQKLGDNDMTIQEKLESVLSKMANETIEIIGSGRTDMGAHARGQVINFKTNCMDSVDKIQKYLYEYLPEDIVVKTVEEVDERFHSRYNVKSKTYLYKIDNNKYHSPFMRKYAAHISKKLDLDRMRKASEYLIGEHDFTSFASSKSKKKSNVREIYSINIKENDDIVEIYIEGNGFLYNMVRIIVGALIDVGLKRKAPQDVKHMLESKDRSKSSDTAPAKGLCLWKVKYE